MRERLRALADDGMTRDGTARIALDIPLFDEEIWEEFSEDEEDDLTEESPEEGIAESDEQHNGGAAKGTTEQRRKIDRDALAREITELGNFETQARSIDVDTKSHALLTALGLGFARMKEMGANGKAVLFTESRRTQDYLKRFLDANGYEGRIVVFNGSNTDAESKAILAEWKTRHTGTDRATGIDRIDIRTALIDRFREKASIFLSTEAGAEGVNLQFASLLINYDLPWNPQRIEQRIGRVHRYGQKFDVVVINFLNSTNQADQRVQELLEEKFALFQGVFGASDEILGSIESGMDFEKRILEIYQTCRTSQAIEEGFNKLRTDLDSRIQERMTATRSMLMENFDEDVHERFKGSLLETRALVDRTSAMFWDLSEYILAGRATFHEASRSFMLHQSPTDAILLGRYSLDRNSPERRYGLGSPLGAFVINQAKGLPVPLAKLTFDIGEHPLRISLVEALSGLSGWLRCSLLVMTRSDSKEEHLVFAGFTDSGHSLDQETMEKLFRVSARAEAIHDAPPPVLQHLAEELECRITGILTRVEERQEGFFNEERERLDRWADDQIKSLETELDLAKKRILELRREERGARNLGEKIHFQGELAALEKRKKRLRMSLFEEEDAINERRDQLIRHMEAQLRQETDAWELYTLRWSVV
jgi:hypothetical protein